jgi:hypothetical protein
MVYDVVATRMDHCGSADVTEADDGKAPRKARGLFIFEWCSEAKYRLPQAVNFSDAHLAAAGAITLQIEVAKIGKITCQISG